MAGSEMKHRIQRAAARQRAHGTQARIGGGPVETIAPIPKPLSSAVGGAQGGTDRCGAHSEISK